MGYSKTFETRIVRVKHKIDFHVGMRARDLMESLKHVPPDAQVDEFLESLGDDNSTGSIEFHEERQEK